MPNLVGNSSWAYSNIDGNADDSMKPEQKLITTAIGNPTCGNNILNGAVPKIETHITAFRPYLSPNGPPTSVPIAVDTTKTNRYI